MVNSFQFLPRLIGTFYQMVEPTIEDAAIPFTPLRKPLSECRLSAITTGGVWVERPFDTIREQAEPMWGDPSYRAIPFNTPQEKVQISHLHLNTSFAQEDINVILPLHRLPTLADRGEIGSVAQTAYSFMGYQGFPPDTTAWQETYLPEVIEQLKAEEVDAVLLTPT